MNTPFLFVRPFPLRIRASGTIALAAGSSDLYSGSDARQDRYQFICTNLSTTLDLKLLDERGVPFMTIFPRTALTLLTNQNISVYNADPGTAVNYEVCELFFDEGTAAGQYEQQLRAAQSGAYSSGGALSITYLGGGNFTARTGIQPSSGGGVRPSR